MVHIKTLAKLTTMQIHPSYQAQFALLTSEKTGILAEYSNFSNIFSSDSVTELPEYTRINNYSIHLLDNKQLPYSPLYSLGLVKLEILKTYIKTNLASGFIRLSKSLSGVLVLFVQKKENSFCLYIDYQGFNNLIIKNHYLLSLIDKLLDYLGCTKCFT